MKFSTHGQGSKCRGRSRAYNIWTSMKQRCLNPRAKDYPLYGGRGITICDRWINRFENFYADMGDCPANMSIERKDNDGPYAPTNYVWATNKVQQRNTRRNYMIEINGVQRCSTEWAEIYGIHRRTLQTRLRRGWTLHKALTTPARNHTYG